MFLFEQEFLGASIALSAHQLLQEYGNMPMVPQQRMGTQYSPPPQQQNSGVDLWNVAKYGGLAGGAALLGTAAIDGSDEWMNKHSYLSWASKPVSWVKSTASDMWNSFGKTADLYNANKELESNYMNAKQAGMLRVRELQGEGKYVEANQKLAEINSPEYAARFGLVPASYSDQQLGKKYTGNLLLMARNEAAAGMVTDEKAGANYGANLAKANEIMKKNPEVFSKEDMKKYGVEPIQTQKKKK